MTSTIRISRLEVLDGDIGKIQFYVNDFYWRRIVRRKKEHYRLLAWFSKQYENAKFIDLGTRAGASAMCLGYNSSNKVRSYDISQKDRYNNNFDFSKFPNIQFVVQDATTILPREYTDADLIFLDISHTGKPERAVLARIHESGFKGILIMDDINHHRFPEMRLLWEDIHRPKLEVSYAHDSGTGLVSYGPNIQLVP